MKKKEEAVELDAFRLSSATLVLESLTPLLANWMTPQRVDRLCRERELKDSGAKKPKHLTPEEHFNECIYPKKNGHHVIRSDSFTASFTQAAKTFATNIDKVQVKGTVSIPAQFVEIEGPEPTIRRDAVRLGDKNRTLDFRYRAEFSKWKASVLIYFNPEGKLGLSQIVNLINLAGFQVGIGDWRPVPPKGNSGTFGRFKVVTNGQK